MEQDLQELKKRIVAKIPNLTESQKVIANYIVDNTQTFALSSIRELEKELNTSKSTIVRLAQVLGYKGFQDLKSTFLKNIRVGLEQVNQQNIAITDHENNSSYLEAIAYESVKNIHSTLQLIDRSQFGQAVKLIKKSEYVYTLGHGISTYLADIASHLLIRISKKSSRLRYGGVSFIEQIGNLSKEDILIAISFPPYAEETIEACKNARNEGVKIIAITDKMTSPILSYGDVYLQTMVENQHSLNSYMPALIVLDSLFTQVENDLKND